MHLKTRWDPERLAVGIGTLVFCLGVRGCAPTPAANQRRSTLLDSDGDGVGDELDKCAETSSGTTVNDVGCPDEDEDGVYDEDDQCPGTEAGQLVSSSGCDFAGTSTLTPGEIYRPRIVSVELFSDPPAEARPLEPVAAVAASLDRRSAEVSAAAVARQRRLRLRPGSRGTVLPEFVPRPGRECAGAADLRPLPNPAIARIDAARVFEGLHSLALEVRALGESASEWLATQLRELQAHLAGAPSLDDGQLLGLIGQARVALRAQSLMDAFAQLDEPRVRAFLLEHPNLLDALRTARQHVYALLAPKRRPTVRLVLHSVERDERELLVEIPTSLGVAEGIAAMDRFDDVWWLDQPNEVRSLLCFDIRFK